MHSREEAINQAASQGQKFYGFTLQMEGEKPVGAEIYHVEKNDDDDEDAEPIIITYLAGRFFSSIGEAGYLDVEDVPKTLEFVSTDVSGLDIDGYRLDFALRILLGIDSQGDCPDCEEVRRLCPDCEDHIRRAVFSQK